MTRRGRRPRKQHKTKKAEREACIRRAAEEASAKGARLQKARYKARGNIIQGSCTEASRQEGDGAWGTRMGRLGIAACTAFPICLWLSMKK